MTLLPCPVCNFLLSEPPEDFTFCPSCGTHFGYHDVGRTYDQIRERWFANGMKWWSPVRPKPKDWNAITQLSAGPLGTITQSLALAELQPNAIAPDFDCFRRHKAAVRGVRRRQFNGKTFGSPSVLDRMRNHYGTRSEAAL